MRKDQIEVGGAYQVGGSRSRGRAVVTGPAEGKKRSWEKRLTFYFPVEYPDSFDEEGKPETGEIAAKDFNHPWSDEDEQRFQRSMANAFKVREAERKLTEAGYEPDSVRTRSDGHGGDGIWISFRGDMAEQVIERLTAR